MHRIKKIFWSPHIDKKIIMLNMQDNIVNRTAMRMCTTFKWRLIDTKYFKYCQWGQYTYLSSALFNFNWYSLCHSYSCCLTIRIHKAEHARSWCRWNYNARVQLLDRLKPLPRISSSLVRTHSRKEKYRYCFLI